MAVFTYDDIANFPGHCRDALAENDKMLSDLIDREHKRQNDRLMMVAAGGLMDPSVLACIGSALANISAEGYPGARYHSGCDVADDVERLAVARAKAAFGAQYANVQPHSGTSANLSVMAALLAPGDTVLGLDLRAGGHLSHGAQPSVSGKYYNAVAYGLGDDGLIDYDQVSRLAESQLPRLIICGASAYPRQIDFARFRTIADSVGAFLLADISHIAGLVVGGQHLSPIDHAHITTTSTYKQINGPRGGLILLGRDAGMVVPDTGLTLAKLLQRAVFPLCQGTPNFGEIAAKARAFDIMAGPAFCRLAERMVANGHALAGALMQCGYRVVTGGTDTHMVLVDLRCRRLTGKIVEEALESCGILANRNMVPGDTGPPNSAGGIRFGVNVLSYRGMRQPEMRQCADFIDTVVGAVEMGPDGRGRVRPDVLSAVTHGVRDLCRRFPLAVSLPAPVLS